MAAKQDTSVRSFRRMTSYTGIPHSIISWYVVMMVIVQSEGF